MTLHTRVAVTTALPVPPEDALRHLLTLMQATPEQVSRMQTRAPDPTAEYEWDRTRPNSVNMPPGIGLPALSWVDYSNTREPLPLDEDETDSLEEAASDPDKFYSPRAHAVIHFDTAYGYKSPNGAGCGDFHAWLVREMGAWLESHGASWTWYDESGNGWHEEWKNDTRFLERHVLSSEWGTLGDPDVGALSSMIPSVTRDSRQAFLEDLVKPALGNMGLNLED